MGIFRNTNLAYVVAAILGVASFILAWKGIEGWGWFLFCSFVVAYDA